MPAEIIKQLGIYKQSYPIIGCKPDIEPMIHLVEQYEVILDHKMVANTQRDSYNSQRKDKETLKKQILIEVDLKKKIIIGLSPRQINKEYYNKELRTCLGNFKFN